MGRADDVFHIRINSVLKETLRKKSTENRRTMTAEIIDRLEKSLEPGGYSVGEMPAKYNTVIDLDVKVITRLLYRIQHAADANGLELTEEQVSHCIEETYSILKSGNEISLEMLNSFVRLAAK